MDSVEPVLGSSTDRVLAAADRVPPGAVASYGDIGAAVGVPARQVGRIMARHGWEVAWWRITDRQGRLPAHLLGEAIAHWREEGIGVRDDGSGCRFDQHRVAVEVLLGSAR